MGRQGSSRTGPEHIGTILASLFRQKRMEDPIRVNRVVLEWDFLVGEQVCRHAKAVHVDHGTLIVEVENSAWMHRLQMQEWELRARINRHFEEEIIRQIRFRLGSAPTPTTVPGSGQENEAG